MSKLVFQTLWWKLIFQEVIIVLGSASQGGTYEQEQTSDSGRENYH
jgi:hypothetical protein